MSEVNDTLRQYRAETARTEADAAASKCAAVNAIAQAAQRLMYGVAALTITSAVAKLILVSIALGG